MKRILLLPIFLFVIGTLFAQTAPRTDIATIEQNFKKLNVLGSVLYVAAHPDDENTRLLAYLAQEMHYRTGYLSLTRGDGGQIRAIYYPNTAARAKDFCATTHSRIFTPKSSARVRPRRSSELPQLHRQAEVQRSSLFGDYC